ncbi:MAG: metal ABC transporter substrate-binding protein, partial [Candidatus Thermoplasmatota archaeon]|nr:metal ABC transporter substrate-binding protein [Candidatus Thermoplasmatota archaeon]
MWTEGEDHGEGLCHNTDTHENYESTEADCATAGHVWMDHEDHDHDLPEIHADRVVHTLSFPEHMVCYDISTHTVNHTYDSEAECEAANMMWTAADSGTSDDDHDDHSDEEDDHDDHSDEEEHHEFGFVVIHIEEEGDYGFALPSDIEMFILMGEGGHDDHDDHGDHGDHDDHDGDDHDDHDDDMVCYDMSTHTVDSSITAEEDCEAAGLMWTAANSGPGGDDDHDDDHSEDGESEIEADEEEEAFDYDPHSWLDPLSFNAQLNLVLMKMTETFPDGADIFAENAAAYGLELTQLHVNFEGAFGDQGACAAAGVDKAIVANHNAYSYISVRYGVDIVTVHGLDPEGEPTPAEVAEVVEHIKEEGITTLYVEEYTDQTAVQSIVEETGVDIQILYTMEMAPSDSNDDYLSMMNKNVQNMISGIGC